MNNCQLGEMEQRFAELIWAHAPVASGELVRLCAEAFAWKKSTTYTMLHRLCERGIFENREGTVHTVLTREAWLSMQSEAFVEETFSGSLPRFLSAFASRKALNEEEVAALEQMIAEYRNSERKGKKE